MTTRFLIALAIAPLIAAASSPPPPAPAAAPAAATAPAATARALEPRWQALLTQLRSPDFATRSAAQKQLDAATPADVPALRALAAAESDQEAKSRLLERAQELEEYTLTNPAPISIDLDNATLTQVAASLSKSLGMHIRVWPEEESFRRNIRFSLTAKDKPFFEILSELSRQHPISFQNFGGELQLQQSAPGLQKLLIKGPIAAGPTSITRSRSFNLQAPAGAELPPEAMGLGGIILVDPRLPILRHSWPRFTRIVDDAGNILFTSQPQEGNLTVGRGNHFTNVSAQLQIPPNPGKVITSAEVLMTYEVVIAEDRLEIDDPAAKAGQSFEFAGQTLKIISFKVAQSDINYQVQFSRPGPVARLLGSRSQFQVAFACVDSTGRSASLGTLEGNASGSIGFGKPLVPPLKIVLSIPTKTRLIEAKFDFKDIPLP